MMHTRVTYTYRDGDNYKQHHEVFLRGTLTEEEIATIYSILDDGDYFIADQVGLPELQSRMLNFPDQQSDHVWHELQSGDIETLDGDLESEDMITAHDLYQRFLDVRTTGWDVPAAMRRLGLLSEDNETDDIGATYAPDDAAYDHTWTPFALRHDALEESDATGAPADQIADIMGFDLSAFEKFLADHTCPDMAATYALIDELPHVAGYYHGDYQIWVYDLGDRIVVVEDAPYAACYILPAKESWPKFNKETSS